MRIIGKIAAIAAILTAVSINAAANGVGDDVLESDIGGKNISESIGSHAGNILVKVIKQKNGEKTTEYTGPLAGYENGAFIGMDFSAMQLAVVFNWDSEDYDVLYIAPVTAAISDEITSSDDLTNIPAVENAVTYQANVVKTEFGNTHIRVSLLYDNAYSESILLQGEELTAEIEVDNTDGESDVDISALIALYDKDGVLISVKEASELFEESSAGKFYNKIVVPDDSTALSAKIMLWDNMSDMQPYVSPLILTANGADYFGDDYSLAQPITGKNKVSGMINAADDTDVFSFIPKIDGLYCFEAFSEADIYASLYAAGNLTTPIASGSSAAADNFRLHATLNAGTTYYIYVNGGQECDYSLNYGYSIGDIFATVSPVKFYDDDPEFNALIEATVELYSYHTDEFVASMHLKDWSSSDSTYASFSMTGIHSGEYLVKIQRKGYLAQYKKITLSDDVIDLGSITLIPGDVNADNIVNSEDVAIITNLLGKVYGEEEYIADADINADKVIDSADLALANANINKTSNDYNDNVNVIIMYTNICDNQLTIFGKAAPNSALSCNIYYDGYSIFYEELTCSENGEFEVTAELNRSGNYIAEISDSDYAFEVQKEIEY